MSEHDVMKIPLTQGKFAVIDEADAARAYDKAAVKHYGDFANINEAPNVGA